MKTIPQSFGRSGRHFELAQRSAHVALYRVYRQTSSNTGPLLGYEVHVIRVRPEGQMFGTPYEASELLASDEAFGKWAWSFGGTNALARALASFNALSKTPGDTGPAVRREDQPASLSPDPLGPLEPLSVDPQGQGGHTAALVQPIPQTFRKNGYSYELERRSEGACIYRQIHRSGLLAAYEVMIIGHQRARLFKGVLFPEAEAVTPKSHWGEEGWTFSVGMYGQSGALDMAVRRFDELNSRPALIGLATRMRGDTPEPISGPTPDAAAAESEAPSRRAGLLTG